MSYTVTTWSNTGFNPDNIPDAPSLLGAGVSYTPIDLVQERDLSFIRISATWSQAKDIDVCKVGDWYYYVSGIEMQAVDVAQLNFSQPDYILSIGGVGNIQLLDGITERCHLSDSSNGDKSDSLLAPLEPLELETVEWNPTDGADTVVVAETTCDAPATFRIRGVAAYEDTSGNSVYVPKQQAIMDGYTCEYELPDDLSATPNKRGTCADIYDIVGNGITAEDVTTTPSQTRIIAPYTYIKEAIVEGLFGLGIPDAVASLVEYPETLVELEIKQLRDDQGTGNGREINGSHMTAYHKITKIKGAKITNSTDAPNFKYLGNTIKNDLLHVSDYTKYGIITCSGAKEEYTVSQIRDTSKTLTQEVRPKVILVVDPNPDGRPYFRFERFNNNNDDEMFLFNALPGLQWKEIPLVYTGKVGSKIDEINRDLTLNQAGQNYALDRAQSVVRTATQSVGNVLNMSYGDIDAGGKMGVAQSVGGIVNMGFDQLRQNYELGMLENNIITNYRTSQVSTPVLRAPYQTEPLRNVLGNGCVIYRYKYSANDAARIDKLITMYGCAYTGQLVNSMFTSRRYFNFVKASNVSCTGHSMRIDAGIAAQLEGGVRIWHVKPDNSYYNTENI